MFTISTKNIDNNTSRGIVYILLIELEDKELVKVGVTCDSKIENRVSDILVSIWKRYRVFPKLYTKRFKTFDDPYIVEKELHKLLEEYRYSTKHRFSGSTEVFFVDLDYVVGLYDDLYIRKSSKK